MHVLNDIVMNHCRITDLHDPEAPQDAATMRFVMDRIEGLSPKGSVKVATTGPITLFGLQEIDGYMLQNGDPVLVKDQVDPSENGIYIAIEEESYYDEELEQTVTLGDWIRAPNADRYEELFGAITHVAGGTENKYMSYITDIPRNGNLGVTPIVWLPWVYQNIPEKVTYRSSTPIGNGADYAFNINHGRGKRWNHVAVYRIADGQKVEVNIQDLGPNNISVSFSPDNDPPDVDEFVVVVIG